MFVIEFINKKISQSKRKKKKTDENRKRKSKGEIIKLKMCHQ